MRWTVRLGEILRLAARDVGAHPLRAALSASSFASAVAITVVLAAGGNGLSGAVASILRTIGEGQISVQPRRTTGMGGQRRAGREVRIRYEDVEDLDGRLPSFDGVAPYFNVFGTGSASRRYSIPWSPARAVSHGYLRVRGAPVVEGRWFSEAECEEGRWVAVLNHGLRRVLFPEGDAVGEWIEWRGRRLEVVGVIDDEAEFPYLVFVPYPAARQIRDARYITGLMARPRPGADWDRSVRELRRVLAGLGGFDPADPNALEIEDNREFTGKVRAGTRALRILVSTIALVSLLLGALGVANMMAISVAERTAEIGLRKALGARRSHIMSQVLTESVTLSVSGGVVGIVLGFLAASGISAATPLSARLETWSAAVGIGITAGVGLFFGLYPASRAAQLDPIEALRRE